MPDKDQKEAKAAAKALLDKPEHKYRAGPDGKDLRDEMTRDDALDDPAKNEED